ncbi:hypothetical protein IFM89_015767, partial [Coptis chinensis]
CSQKVCSAGAMRKVIQLVKSAMSRIIQPGYTAPPLHLRMPPPLISVGVHLTCSAVNGTSALFLLRAAGFLLPCYIMAWAISILQRRRQRQEAARLAATEVAFLIQSGLRPGQRGGLQFTVAPGACTCTCISSTPRQDHGPFAKLAKHYSTCLISDLLDNMVADASQAPEIAQNLPPNAKTKHNTQLLKRFMLSIRIRERLGPRSGDISTQSGPSILLWHLQGRLGPRSSPQDLSHNAHPYDEETLMFMLLRLTRENDQLRRNDDKRPREENSQQEFSVPRESRFQKKRHHLRSHASSRTQNHRTPIVERLGGADTILGWREQPQRDKDRNNHNKDAKTGITQSQKQDGRSSKDLTLLEFSVSLLELYDKLKGKPSKSFPMKLDTEGRLDKSKKCKYHNDFGYTLNDCYAFKKEISRMADVGQLKEYLKGSQKLAHVNLVEHDVIAVCHAQAAASSSNRERKWSMKRNIKKIGSWNHPHITTGEGKIEIDLDMAVHGECKPKLQDLKLGSGFLMVIGVASSSSEE